VCASLADLATVDVSRGDTVVAVPLGSTEQHGAHLPLSTDTDIAVALCSALAAERSDVIVAPAVPYGSSGEHAGFAGTLSIGQEAIELVLVELARSATETFPHVLFVSAHGGNVAPATRAVATLRAEGRDVSLFQPTWDGDAHAGHVETSLQLVLRPDAVRIDRAVVGETRPLAELMPLLRTGGVRAVTATGVLGDPTTASETAGREAFAALVAGLTAHVATWRSR
jgi:mycofactocin system creatininase family protein